MDFQIFCTQMFKQNTRDLPKKMKNLRESLIH